ncbi:unnamed protein product, partial [Polarella glacialis]
ATAALDAAADARVQAVLEERFCSRGVTVMQVAHRLASVARCSRIAVLADGALAEIGTPAELLVREPSSGPACGQGQLRDMVARLGDQEAAEFREVGCCQEQQRQQQLQVSKESLFWHL